MDAEFQELAEEIERIATSSEFNGISLLNSATGTTTIHFGSATTLTVNMADMTKSGLGIDSIDIKGADSANNALGTLTSAINTKDSARAAFGYKMTRLEATSQVLGIQAENLATAESRISDVDVATEMSALTRNQVLAQAGVSMLAQANAMPQMALSLLR